MTVAAPTLMTTEQLLALPDDGVERWLIRGQLRERHPDQTTGKPMTVRNSEHSQIMTRIAQALANWLDEQPQPRGAVLCGAAGVRLHRDAGQYGWRRCRLRRCRGGRAPI